ncbi:MAG TPA: type I DNA topoisomerase, partial [Candidatus Parcubacteria bacterium]|nr:type I DNA topoisomerase [Candidatus Parcubacteria bacterium]
MNLVIVESPTKSRTIGKFLGPDFKVLSSYGHVRDLPKDELGVDVEKDFKPKYIIIPKAKKTIQSLKKEVKEAKTVILATDEDREGEAIAFHLTNALELEKPQRIVFHEITKSAIAKALENPREININLVDAQQTRRILDRIVGYKLSPFLWKKVARRLSAGRVQSVAVRLVAEREKEIKDFVPKEYWSITAFLRQEKGGEFEARLTKENGKVILKLGINNQKEADKIIKNLEKAEYKIVNVEKKEIKRNPLPPFMTSTLQQEAWKKLRFPARFTMSVAQNLYERGLITYHRTDSLNIANQALLDAKKFISDNYGAKHWAGFLRKYKAKGRAQEAHEAIRPAYSESAPDTLKSKVKLDDNQYRLYDLIWRRFIASQMAQAVFDSTIIDIEAKQYTFRANGQIMKFDGFLKIYPLKYEETQLPNLKTDEILKLQKLTPLQHFTQPSPRFTEATLIKALEENGIGRPSTYATIISTIQLRNYIEKNE